MSEKKMLSATEILEVQDLVVVEVDIPEWGGTVRLRPMSAEEAISYNDTVTKGDKRHGAVKLAALCLVKEDGTAMFTEEQAGLLQKKSLAGLMRIQRVALKINGLTEEAVKDVKND